MQFTTTRPRLLALLNPAKLQRLQKALGKDWEILPATNLDLSREPAEPVVLDPALLTPHARELSAIISSRGAGRMLIYTALNAESLPIFLQLIRAGAKQVVLWDFDDSASRLQVMAAELLHPDLSERFVFEISGRLNQLPPRLNRVLRDVFNRPEAYDSVESLCLAAAAARRSCNRWFDRAQLRSLRALLTAARVLKAVPLLRAGHMKAPSVAFHVGAGGAAGLARDVRTVLKTTLRGVAELTDSEVVSRASGYVCASG